MITYKDRTFCSSDCDNYECYRFYDSGVKADADAAGLPVSLADFGPTCPYQLTLKKKSENEQL